jgi:hypothetical protein
VNSQYRRGLRLLLPIGVLALIATSAAFSAPAQTAYTIDFYAISPGVNTLANNCFALSGTLAEAAPGYSSYIGYAVFSGFWATAPGAAVDEVFFTGFEEC